MEAMEIVSLGIIQQLSRISRVLSTEQVDLDADESRILHQNLWSLTLDS